MLDAFKLHSNSRRSAPDGMAEGIVVNASANANSLIKDNRSLLHLHHHQSYLDLPGAGN
jgi:hypothetical protein